jgi:predicted phage terminase large subunit-like protein
MRANRGTKVNVIGPRGSAKSTIATLCHVLHAAVEGWERYIWIVSDTKEQAQIHLDNIKAELMGNALLRSHYPLGVVQGRHWRATSIELAHGVAIESYGTGQSVRGRRRSADRPTLIVCDDLQNDSHIASANQREASRQWFNGTLLNAGTKDTNIVNLATALHREALALELHRSAGWTSHSFPAIESWPTNSELWNEWESLYCDVDNPHAKVAAREFYDQRRDAMQEGARVLWPAVEDLYTLMQTRVEIGHTAFEREKQSSPVNPEFCEWPEAYFADHIWFEHWPEELTIRTIALDPSKGRDSGRGDYSAYALLGIDSRGVMYVEADIARRPTPQMVAEGVELCRRFPPQAFGVEANQFQELLCGEFASEFARQGLGHIVPAAIHNHANKLVRIRRLGPYLSQHRLRFLASSPATRLLVDQLRDFPAAAHDDGPDALEMALRLAEDVWNGRNNNSNDGLGDRLLVART